MRDAVILGILQFLNWAICTISWRAVAQANFLASVITDTTLASLQFFVLRKIAKSEATTLVPWIGYTVGGVLGTVVGLQLSLILLGK